MTATQVLVAVFSGGGLVGAVLAVFRFRPELDRQSVATATELMTTLRAELAAERAEKDAMRRRIEQLETQVADLLSRLGLGGVGG